ncbi:MAG: hypothetical protein Kow00109_08650 [Acidobacteriota bacterium]
MRKRLVGCLVTLVLAFPVLGQMGMHEWPMGSPISFRGPVVRVDRDDSGRAVRLLIQVNRSLQWVSLSSWTAVVAGLGFPSNPSSIHPGEFVEVSGYFTRVYPRSGGNPQITIFADRIHRQNASDLEMEGPVDAVGPDSVTIRGLLFRLTEQSEVRPSRAPEAAALDLTPGVTARVRARWVSGEPVVLELEYGPRTVESEPLRLMGVLQRVDGSVVQGNAWLWVEIGVEVAGYGRIATPVALNPSTRVEGELTKGSLVLIEGRFPPGESYVVAERVAGDRNQNQNPLDDATSLDLAPSEGEVRGRIEKHQQDSTGAGRLLVAGQTILYNTQTAILDCEGAPVGPEVLEIGALIEAEGTVDSRNQLLARKIEIECHRDAGDAHSGDSDQEGGETADSGGNQDDTAPPGAGDDHSGGDPDDDSSGPGGDSGDSGGVSDEDSHPRIEIEGIILSISPGSEGALLELVVQAEDLGAVTVLVDNDTEIRDHEGEPADTGVLTAGGEVEVRGIQLPTGEILARRIEVKG